MNKPYVIYTVIINNYDILNNINLSEFEKTLIDCICFSNTEMPDNRGWNIQDISTLFDDINSTGIARKIKLLGPNKFLYKYSASLFVDGNVLIKPNIYSIFNLLKISDFIVYTHPMLNCVHDEVEYIDKLGIITSPEKLIIKDLIKDIPRNLGYVETCILLRNHNESNFNFSQEWHNNLLEPSLRDQWCFKYTWYIFSIKNLYMKILFMDVYERNKYFIKYRQHIKKKGINNFFIIKLIPYNYYSYLYRFFSVNHIFNKLIYNIFMLINYIYDVIYKNILDENGLLYKCLNSYNYENFLKKHSSNRSSPIIFNKYIDIFTKINYYMIPIIWMPIMIFYLSNNDISFNVISLLFLIGMFSWTFIEYVIHRFLFHNNYIIKKGNKFLNLIHFLLHGIHRIIPFDKYRLVTPPILLLRLGRIY